MDAAIILGAATVGPIMDPSASGSASARSVMAIAAVTLVGDTMAGDVAAATISPLET